MQKDKKQQDQVPQKKQEQTIFQKVKSKLYSIFCGDPQLDPTINRSIVSNTYAQIIEFVNIIVILKIFEVTNNTFITITQSACSGIIILICLIPRMSNRHVSLMITMASFSVISLASAAFNYLLIIKQFVRDLAFLSFRIIVSCFIINLQQTMISTMKIQNLYVLEIIIEFGLIIYRIIFVVLMFKAFETAKKKFDEKQKRKRRKDRFNENLVNKNLYNPDRKI